jgi:hypothetical protein
MGFNSAFKGLIVRWRFRYMEDWLNCFEMYWMSALWSIYRCVTRLELWYAVKWNGKWRHRRRYSTPYDAAVWVRHSVLAQKPASIPGDCLNGKNLSVLSWQVYFTTARREFFKFSGIIVLCFLAEIFQDAGLGETSPIFRSRNLTSLKKCLQFYRDSKIIHFGMHLLSLCLYMCCIARGKPVETCQR